MMKRATQRPIPLFDDASPAAPAGDDARGRVRIFAEAVARRHRRSKAGVREFVAAFRGYYRTLSICAEERLPALDDELIGFATRAYLAVRSKGHSAAA